MEQHDIVGLGTILSIWAHPDDETYLAAGVMAAATDSGQRVVCVCASDGELGTSDPATWPPERLAALRRREFAAAMAVLGVSEHRMLGLPDGSLSEWERAGMAAVTAAIEEVEPDTILTFGAEGMTFHPDHVAVHRWVTEAWRRRGCRARLLYATASSDHLDRFGPLYEEWGVYMDDRRPVGTSRTELALDVELAGPALDRKLTALRCLSSQTSGPSAALGDIYAAMVTDECFVENADVALTAPFRGGERDVNR